MSAARLRLMPWIVAAVAMSPVAGLAQMQMPDMDAPMGQMPMGSAPMVPAAPAGQQAPIGTGEGEVRRIDQETNKIQVAHGPIQGEFEMRAMTMTIQAPSWEMIEKLGVGDRIKFTVARAGGAYSLISLEVVEKKAAAGG